MLKDVLLTALVVLTFTSVAHAETPDAVAQGKYFAVLGDCAGCHTNGNGPAFAGGEGFSATFGTVYAANITPDKETGIGKWTAEQFHRAMHDGIRADGAHLYPAFPYAYFSHISRADTDAVFAYLKTLKPVHAIPPKNQLIFPLNIRAVMWSWDAMFLDKRPFRADLSKSAAWNRGAAIVNDLGHCAACHTPKNLLFGDETDKAFTGTVLDNWFSANLTGNKRDGLGRWIAADIVQYLKTGQNSYATAAGSMQEVVTDSTSHMNDGDLAAIATYLKSRPATPEKAPPAPDAHTMQAGQTVFVENCSACHLEPNPSAPRDYPKLAGDTLIAGRDPTTVLHIVLEGAQSSITPNAKTGYSMPSFVALTDQDIADVTTYIRNAWGNRASSVSRGDVSRLRSAIAESN
jgi:mono/diheme cytochrome c family protein